VLNTVSFYKVQKSEILGANLLHERAYGEPEAVYQAEVVYDGVGLGGSEARELAGVLLAPLVP